MPWRRPTLWAANWPGLSWEWIVDRDLVAYYRARAPEYEQVYYRDVPERRRELAAAAASLRRVVGGREVLDLACGTGYWTEIMSAAARFIVAVDVSVEMIRRAVGKHYRCQTWFVLSDLYDFPFAPRAFDVVTLGFWFSHEPKQQYQRFLTALRGLCRPGGYLWMIDNNLPAEGTDRDIARTDPQGNTYKRRRLNSGQEYVILKNYFTEDQLRQVFREWFTVEQVVYGRYYWSVLLRVTS